MLSLDTRIRMSLAKVTPLPRGNEPSRALGKRIRELRLERDVTQGELARRAKIQRPNVSRIERGTHMQSLDVVLRIAAALRVKPSAILCVLDEEG